MSHNEPNQEDVLLDRLVDGELSGIERRRLLESLDIRPEGWRRCALAFLEAQSWREEFGQVARLPRPESTQPAPTKRQWRSGLQLLALAAALLLAFGTGWLDRPHHEPFAGSPLQSNSQLAQAVPPMGNAPSGKTDDALTLFVKDKAGNMRPVYVPLVDAGTLDHELGVAFQPGMTDDVREQLKNEGYDVESKRQYARFWLENGRPMIVPVEDTKIVPVSNKVF